MSNYLSFQLNNERKARLHRVSKGIGYITLTAGLVVVFGWIVDSPMLKQVISGLPTMKLNTALLFVLTGGSLVTVERTSISRLCAAMAVIIASLTLCEYLFDWNVGIDELFIQDVRTRTAGDAFPGRMSVITALNFLLLSINLLLIHSRQRIGYLFTVLSLLLTFIALTAYVYDAQSLEQIFPYSTLAIHTAVLFFLSGMGILFRQTDTFFLQIFASDSTSGIIVRRLIPVVVILPIVTGWLRLQGQLMGLYDIAFGTTLTVVVNMVILLISIWWVITYLVKVDSERIRAQESLLQAQHDLEDRVIERTLELAQAIEDLEDSRAKFAGVINTAHDGVISIDDSQRITLFNQGAERIFGYTADEILGKPIDTLLPKRFHTQHTQHITQFGLGDRSARIMTPDRSEVRGKRKSGQEFPAEVSISSLLLNGHYIYTAVVRDASTHRESERQLLQYANALERSNKELESFVYVASHDLQEPLRKIQAFSSRLKKNYGEQLDEKAGEYLHHLIDASGRMRLLIQDLLSYSRVTTQAKPFAKVDLNNVLKSVLSDLEITIENTQAQIEVEQLATIEADEVQMHQLFQNLIGNSIKYRKDDRTPIIQIRGRLTRSTIEEVEQSVYEVVVSDNGIGFDNKYAKRIMGIFQRLHGRSRYEGTGIGLAICQKVVERHRGEIIADGVVGEGSSITVRLPSYQPSMEADIQYEQET